MGKVLPLCRDADIFDQMFLANRTDQMCCAPGMLDVPHSNFILNWKFISRAKSQEQGIFKEIQTASHHKKRVPSVVF